MFELFCLPSEKGFTVNGKDLLHLLERKQVNIKAPLQDFGIKIVNT